MTIFSQRFSGQLTAQDCKKHINQPFEVPEAVGTLHIDVWIESSAPEVTNISLSLYDPSGFRGAGHRQHVHHAVRLSAGSATPGYLSGAIQPGPWTLALDTHMIIDGAPVDYSIQITGIAEVTEGMGALAQVPAARPSALRGPGWYRGDLHGHTLHSDGAWDVPDLVAAARARGLDFVTLSDHNTIAPLRQMDDLSTPALLTIGGLELTTYWGHALALGTRAWVDWRVSPERTMPSIAAEVGASGALFIIAHPRSPGDPECTGCRWMYADMMPGNGRVVEIWNGGQWADYNEDGLALWYSWLREGYQMVATAGTDVHGPAPAALAEAPIGLNVVYAETLSEHAVLDAIRTGHLYVSDGPSLTFNALANGEIIGMMGDSVPADGLELALTWASCQPGQVARLLTDQGITREWTLTPAGALIVDYPTDSHWIVVEIRAGYGALSAVTNPIYIDTFLR